MRVIKEVVLFCFLAIGISACFNPPEFSDLPKLTFKDIRFKEVVNKKDSLILFLDFEDGNGDLGSSALDYNPDKFYYLAIGGGDTVRMSSFKFEKYTVLNPGIFSGKLVIDKTRSESGYSYLPVYDPTTCYNYEINTLLLVPTSIVDGTYDTGETVMIGSTPYVLIKDPVLFKNNPYFYNIYIKFFQFQGGDFVEFDWFKPIEYCFTYNGNFETSNDPTPEYNGKPIEGSIRYAMPGEFLTVFGSNKLRITAQIRDRAGNFSNKVSTEFDLDEIR